jgi:hypothetical protein
MLVVTGMEVSRRKDYKGSTPFAIDLIDNDTPQRRALSFRLVVNYDGLHAIKEVVDALIERKSATAESREKKNSHRCAPTPSGEAIL